MPNTTQSSLKFTGLMWKLLLLSLILRLPAYGETVTVIFPSDVVTNHVINVPANQAIRMHYVTPQYGCYLTKDSLTVKLGDNVTPLPKR